MQYTGQNLASVYRIFSIDESTLGKIATFSPQNRPHLTHKIDHIFFRQSMFQNNKVIKLFLLFIQCLGAYRVGHLAPLALICDAPYQNQALLAILSLVTNPVCNFVENF